MRHIGEILASFFDTVDVLVEPSGTHEHRQSGLGSIATGFSDLDQLTGGLHRSEMIVIGGVPSIGKTSFVLGIAYGAAVIHGKTIGMFAPGVLSEDIMQRILSMESGVDTHRLRLGQIDDGEWDRISRAFGRLSEAPLFIDDSAMNLEEMRSNADQLQSAHGLDLIIVDCVQLLNTPRRASRAQEISELSRGLKGLARDLRVPILVVSQISRAVERRANHIPVLTDLDGSLDEDADAVVFIHREDRFEHDSERKGIADIIVAKHRNGPEGQVILRFFDRTARFSDLEIYVTSES